MILVIVILLVIILMLLAYVMILKKREKEWIIKKQQLEEENRKKDKGLKMFVTKFNVASSWLRIIYKHRSIVEDLKKKNIDQIIVYGASEFALRFIEECEKENINVAAIADRQVSGRGYAYKGIPLISIEDILEPEMENTCIVITAMGYAEEIEKEFQTRGIKNYMFLQELADSI